MELKYQAPCDNPRVAKIKKEILKDFFDCLNSFEMNSKESNMTWLDGMSKSIKGLQEAIELVDKANEGRERFNLSQLQQQRNKLNRQISSLKKVALKTT